MYAYSYLSFVFLAFQEYNRPYKTKGNDSMDKRLYLVIIADIIGSRKIEDRKAVQVKLEKTLDQINKSYRQAIASKFIITLGDEFQGVLRDGSVVMEIVSTIQREMYPTLFRFGIGVGTISIELQADTSLGSDGAAFHLARDMVKEVKAHEGKRAGSKNNMLIGIESHQSTVALLNSILKLASALQGNWTERQREVIATLEKYPGTQTEIAKRLGIVQSSVQKSLASSNFPLYKEAIDTVAKTLTAIMQENPSA